MIITVSGQIGAGKSTLAKDLAEKFNLKYISAGGIMREMAQEHEMSIMEFSKFAELNSWIDREIDEKQKKLAEESDNCIVEGRISAHFLQADLKVFLIAPQKIRAKRIMRRDNFSSMEKAIKAIEAREKSERRRYQKIYGIDLDDLESYDLVLNTAKFTSQQIEVIVAGVIERVIMSKS